MTPSKEQGTSEPTPDKRQAEEQPEAEPKRPARPKEIGGPKGPEPTRYGDWERNGRCTDF